jgi:hypothetical protein
LEEEQSMLAERKSEPLLRLVVLSLADLWAALKSGESMKPGSKRWWLGLLVLESWHLLVLLQLELMMRPKLEELKRR